ncbi:hypothetical protein BO78DRAFT_450124 [Aspergillus sclerotiicarbonarius CBS 121057]|uniref:Uncharacterized protein n=1 Tax=Aspergillus sclerotiicarbonarius (strain CBS 121057 / IBT 28362) TaxID=1448318 RepID=A0A319ECD9_ASPSB|nr:hypothetical protein BO78DRAFT_450124 [Aspergillus sclerotiicarbonarius CBS 121057]
MGQLVVHWFECNHLYPEWKTDYLPFEAGPDEHVAPVAALHAFSCPACISPPTKSNASRRLHIITAQILGIILDIPVNDEEFLHSMVHFYARGDHLRWDQPPAPGAIFLPEDPHLQSMWVESYMNSTGLEECRAVVGYAFDAIIPEVKRTEFRERSSLNYECINYLPKSSYYYLALIPLAKPETDYDEFPPDEAPIQQAIAEYQTPTTVQRVQTTQAAHSFVRMDPSVAQSDPFVSDPASVPREPNAQTAPGPPKQRPWLRELPKINTRQRVLRRKSCPDRTPSPSSGDSTWSMVSDSPVRRYGPRYRVPSRVNPPATAIGNNSQNPPMSITVDTSVRATENENQESAPVTDNFQLSQSADVNPPAVPAYMQPDALDNVLERLSNFAQHNPWSLSPVDWCEQAPRVMSRDDSPPVLYLENEETALGESPPPAFFPELPTEEPHLLQDLPTTEPEVEPNDYEPGHGLNQDNPFEYDFPLFDDSE